MQGTPGCISLTVNIEIPKGQNMVVLVRYLKRPLRAAANALSPAADKKYA
jgi:hypothetical protein